MIPLYVPKLVAMQLRAGQQYRSLFDNIAPAKADEKQFDQRAQNAVEGRAPGGSEA